MATAASCRPDERSAAVWNAEIKSFAQRGHIERALTVFFDMRTSRRAPDSHTFPPLLAGVDSRHLCRPVHALVVKAGLHGDRFCTASLIAMYSRAGMLSDAKLAFFSGGAAAGADAVVWSSLIAACTRCGSERDALRALAGMLAAGVRPTAFAYSNAFAACGRLAALGLGRQVHGHAVKSNVQIDAAMSNALVTMYSESGAVGDARKVFDGNADRNNAVSFNAMIAAAAQHGLPAEAAELFFEMKQRGLQPDDVTVLNLLNAFNHAGLVGDGLRLFERMEEDEGVKKTYQHYACVVDMLARAGELERAVAVIKTMPFEAETALWRIILGACRIHKDIAVAREVARMLLEIEGSEPANYAMLANVYTSAGEPREAARVRDLMTARGVGKDESFSWVELGPETHKFAVNDRTHPRSPEIYGHLHRLIGEIADAWYVPGGSFVQYHCEKLAFAFADMSAAPGRAVGVMKNLRVCGDCHEAYKLFSLVTGRTIVLKDNHRFHHFAAGSCSCGDFW